MKIPLPFLISLLGLAACTAAKDESGSTNRNATPVAHTTVVDCILYDGMTKQSEQLTTVSPGSEVLVVDTVNSYFVKARVTQNGQVMNGYMYRNCFPQQ